MEEVWVKETWWPSTKTCIGIVPIWFQFQCSWFHWPCWTVEIWAQKSVGAFTISFFAAPWLLVLLPGVWGNGIHWSVKDWDDSHRGFNDFILKVEKYGCGGREGGSPLEAPFVRLLGRFTLLPHSVHTTQCPYHTVSIPHCINHTTNCATRPDPASMTAVQQSAVQLQ